MIKKKIDLNFNAVVSLSLLLCSNYYFFKDQWFDVDHLALKEDYFVLFLFLFLFFFFFKAIKASPLIDFKAFILNGIPGE